jgi:hypothetical protein
LANKAFPDGVGASHRQAQSPLASHLRWWLLAVIGLVLLAALWGMFGGGKTSATTAAGPEATLRIDAPAIVRNGETFEMRFTVEAHRAITRPVIGVAESYWRGIVLNSSTPRPSGESFENGLFLFEFEPLEPGAAMVFKIDAEVSPSRRGRTEGLAAVRDGQRLLAQGPISLRVLP